MIDIRKFDDLGEARLDWLHARYHFSFAGYDNPARRGWGDLLVWNDDTIQPKTGFARHGHRDMEIITYVREGAITHRDSFGNEGRTEAGDVQVMSAGEGILHEEWNLEDTETRLFQIWIRPAKDGGRPYWDAAKFPRDGRAGRLVELASGRANAAPEALPIGADAAVLGATLKAGDEITHKLGKDRAAYLVPSKGRITVDGQPVDERSGAAIAGLDEITIAATNDAEIVLVDVPA